MALVSAGMLILISFRIMWTLQKSIAEYSKSRVYLRGVEGLQGRCAGGYRWPMADALSLTTHVSGANPVRRITSSHQSKLCPPTTSS